MLPVFILLVILFEGLAISQTWVTCLPTTPGIPEETLPTLQVVAIPDYPVAAGEKVSLQCSTTTILTSMTWSWQRLQNHTWKQEGTSRELILTMPEQSGEYRCCVQNRLLHKCTDQTYTVYIISTQVTVGEKLGIAAFFFSFLALIIIVGIVFWLGCQRFNETLTTSSTAVKEFPGPEMTSKGDLPQADSDVYMNYTSTKQVYNDLDPTSMTDESVYSSLP